MHPSIFFYNFSVFVFMIREQAIRACRVYIFLRVPLLFKQWSCRRVEGLLFWLTLFIALFSALFFCVSWF